MMKPHASDLRQGTIQAVDGDTLLVAIAGEPACGSCAQRGSCATRPTPLLRVPRATSGLVGEPTAGMPVTLDVEVPMVRAALLGYLAPVLALIAGAVAGQAVASLVAMPAPGSLTSDLGAAGGALLGFIAALVLLRRRDRPLRIRALADLGP